jgi:sugar lactone lactonase YvrE
MTNRFIRVLGVVVLGCVLAAPARADKVVLVAGGGAGGAGSPALEAKLAQPFGVLFDPAGRLVIVEYASGLRAIDTAGKLVTLAGDGKPGDAGDGGPATAAKLRQPHAIAVGPDKALYVADTYNHRIRRIDPATGVITTFAGGAQGFGGDGGPADKAQFSELYCIAMTPTGDRMIVTDLGNRRIRAIDMKTKIVTTIAGNGQKGVPADGATATEAPLVDPRAATMDSKGNLYLLERAGHALRMVDASGKVKTLVAGPKESKGPRTLSGPKHLCIDPKDDSVIIADTDNHRVVRWSPSEQKLIPIAGTGKKGTDGVGGPAAQVQLNQPHGVYVDAQGRLYISDSMNNRVLRVEQ